MTKILVADDDFDLLELTVMNVQNYTERKGMVHQIETASDGNEAIASLQKSVPDDTVLLTDYQMGAGPDGVDVIEEAIRLGVSKIFIITSVELDKVRPIKNPLNLRLHDAVHKHTNKVTHILKGNRQAFAEQVYDCLDKLKFA